MKKQILRQAFLVFSFLTLLAVAAQAENFVGSRKSDKYHYPECVWAKKIKPENRIIFGSPQEARNSGYIPCKVCRPPKK